MWGLRAEGGDGCKGASADLPRWSFLIESLERRRQHTVIPSSVVGV